MGVASRGGGAFRTSLDLPCCFLDSRHFWCSILVNQIRLQKVQDRVESCPGILDSLAEPGDPLVKIRAYDWTGYVD